MTSNVSFNSIYSHVFFVEQVSSEPILQRNNTLNVLNSTQLSRAHTREMLTFSSVTSPKPELIITIQVDSNDTKIP